MRDSIKKYAAIRRLVADMTTTAFINEWFFQEVVVAQVVEPWHSVWAGRVRIPGWTLAFFSSELLSIYSHWVSGFF